MAEDRGEVLTSLEAIFGTTVEHEVIKMVLQSCGWDSGSASEVLLAMVDKEDLPEGSKGLLETAGPSGLESFVEASNARPEEREASRGAEGSPKTPTGVESESSSPSCSPLRCPPPSGDAAGHNSSQWVLAPEFVPNAFNQNPSGIWPLGMSRSLAPRGPGARPKPKKVTKKEQVVGRIVSGAKILILMRGLPGSGKSTLAREVRGRHGVVLSADDYFCDRRGRYCYDPGKVGTAHQWTRHRAAQRLREGRTPLVVDNTNLEAWEMRPYVKLALQFGYEVETLEPDTPWRNNPRELARRNTHGVPRNKIVEMRARYDQDVKVERLVAELQGCQGAHARNSPPQDAAGPEEVFWSSDEEADVVIEAYGSEDEALVKERTQEEGGTEGATNKVDENEDNTAFQDCNAVQDVGKTQEASDEAEGCVKVMGVLEDTAQMEIMKELCNVAQIQPQKEACSAAQMEILKELCNVAQIQPQKEACNAAQMEIMKELCNVAQIQPQKEACNAAQMEILKELCNDIAQIQPMKEGCSDTAQIEILKESGSDTQIETLKEACNVAQIETLNEPCNPAQIETLKDPCNSAQIDTLKEPCADTEMGILRESCNDTAQIKILKDSCNDIAQIEAEWDVITSQVTWEGEITDQKFNELVMSFDCAMKEQLLKKRNSVSLAGTEASAVSADVSHILDEDSVMYELCSNMEKAIGQSYSKRQCRNDADHKDDVTEVLTISSPKTTGADVLTDAQSKIDDNGVRTSDDDEDYSDDVPIVLVAKDGHDQDVDSIKAAQEPHDAANDSLSTQEPHDAANDSLSTWECIDTTGQSPLDWDATGKAAGCPKGTSSKPTRTSRRRRPEGDPTKWLKEEEEEKEVACDPEVASWNPVQGGLLSWDADEGVNVSQTEVYGWGRTSEPHTGAVVKCPRQKPNAKTVAGASLMAPLDDAPSYPSADFEVPDDEGVTDVGTQTRYAADFEVSSPLTKVLYGRLDYVPYDARPPEVGPLTTGKLRLDKGTTTEGALDVGPFRNLVSLFPKISEEDLKDVYDKCDSNLNWATNVLLDGGYEMSDLTDAEPLDTEPLDTESASTGDGKDERSSVASDVSSSDLAAEERRTRRFRQSLRQEDLERKRDLESAFDASDYVDGRVTRLTGKGVEDLNATRLQRGRRKHQRARQDAKDASGAQYVTLVMDAHFASRLNRMFGPVGSCEMTSGHFDAPDRSVVLPLELCHAIHACWADTLDGTFQHEAEVLDALIQEDEAFARRLQEEEDSAGRADAPGDAPFGDDPPRGLREIMDLERALQESRGRRPPPTSLSLSSQLALRRLRSEYPQVDPSALEEAFALGGHSYEGASRGLRERYGAGPGAPKTVVAPEALYRYEQQLIKQTLRLSLEEQQQKRRDEQHETRDLAPDDPQVYRDEANLHYRQRQEAFRKAKDASSQGMKAVAAYYARLGHEHSARLAEANQRASRRILEAANAEDANRLDLHQLHVSEALSAAQGFLSERRRVMAARGIKRLRVSLITGHGAHSRGGRARIKPTIHEFLRKSGYAFHESNRGMFAVTLQSD